MQVFRVVAGLLADRTQECHDVVLGLRALDLVDAGGRAHLRGPAQPLRDLDRDEAELRLSLAGQELDVQPRRELRLLGPEPGHLGRGVAVDHTTPPTTGMGTSASRSRPTPTIETGTPVMCSMRSRNARAASGRSSIARTSEVRPHPGSSS